MADIKINGVTPSGFYYGGTAASAVYYGATKLWEAAPAGAVIGGKTYPTVTMPDGHEWLAVNLDYAWSNLTICTSTVSASSTVAYAAYYNCDEATYGWNGLKYGLLYNWKAANYLNSNKSTLCPGWHVPSAQELQALKTAVESDGKDAYSLRGNDGWASGSGTNDYGFTMPPSGLWDNSNSAFSGLTYDSLIWAYDQSSSSIGNRLYVHHDSSTIYKDTKNKRAYLSIRLVKDST